MCDSSYAMRAVPSVCIQFNSHSMQYAPLRAVWGAMHAAGCTGSHGITGQMVARNQERKTASQPQETVCCVPCQVSTQLDHPPPLRILFRIRDKETSVQHSNIR